MKNISKDSLVPELVVIGMYNAYMGYQFLEDSDLIQSFYVDEYDKKEIFKKWLSLYTTCPFTENQWRNVPEFKELHSKEIVDALTSSKYFKDKTYTGGQTLEGSRFFTMRPPDVLGLSIEEKMSMLYGIFLRWGKFVEGDSIKFEFANNSHKVEFIKDLLYKFPYVSSVTVQTKARIPTLNKVWIDECTELCMLFEQWVSQENISHV